MNVTPRIEEISSTAHPRVPEGISFDDLGRIRVLEVECQLCVRARPSHCCVPVLGWCAQPEVRDHAEHLREESRTFLDSACRVLLLPVARTQCLCNGAFAEVSSFRTSTASFVESQLKLAQQVDEEKMKVGTAARLTITSISLTARFISQAIGARNLLKTLAKQREAQIQRLQALIVEKETEAARSIDALRPRFAQAHTPARTGFSCRPSHSSACVGSKSRPSPCLWDRHDPIVTRLQVVHEFPSSSSSMDPPSYTHL
jgi:hypothetical protein